MGSPTKYSIKKTQVFDSSNRMAIAKTFFEEMGISDIDKYILAFLLKGNTSGAEPSFPDILKKIYLPRVKISDFDRKNMLKWIDLLKRQLKELDSYGIADLEGQKLIKMAKNGKYISTFGMRIDPVVYRSIIEILERSPGYVLEVFLGVGLFIDMLADFLKIELPDEETEKANIE